MDSFLEKFKPQALAPLPVPEVPAPDMEIPIAGNRYLSPTALMAFESSPDSFVTNYVWQHVRYPPSEAMLIGSAFDCHVKSYIAGEVYGSDKAEVELERLLADAIEEGPARAWAIEEGKKVFDRYVRTGAVADITLALAHLDGDVMYEFRAATDLEYEDGFSVPIMGKPDLFFVSKTGVNVILDWKVNGYMSSATPQASYINLLEADGKRRGPARTVWSTDYKGFKVAQQPPSTAWATQLGMYCLMLSPEAKHADWIIGIDQLAFPEGSAGGLQVAQHRFHCSHALQQSLRRRIRVAWEGIKSGHYYLRLSKEESDARVRMLSRRGGKQLYNLPPINNSHTY